MNRAGVPLRVFWGAKCLLLCPWWLSIWILAFGEESPITCIKWSPAFPAPLNVSFNVPKWKVLVFMHPKGGRTLSFAGRTPWEVTSWPRKFSLERQKVAATGRECKCQPRWNTRCQACQQLRNQNSGGLANDRTTGWETAMVTWYHPSVKPLHPFHLTRRSISLISWASSIWGKVSSC